jgi:hypothetical protein
MTRLLQSKDVRPLEIHVHGITPDGSLQSEVNVYTLSQDQIVPTWHEYPPILVRVYAFRR